MPPHRPRTPTHTLSSALALQALLATSALTLSLSSPAHADREREALGTPYFEELRARAQSAFDELDERIDDEFDGGAERKREAAREAEAKREAKREALAREAQARALAARESARREAEAREAAERAIERAEARRLAAERARQEEEARRYEAERIAAEERRARILEEQARRAAERESAIAQERAAQLAAARASEHAQAHESNDPPPNDAPERPQYAREMAEVLALVNAERARGGDCGGQRFEPSPPLKANRQLDAAALIHAKAMERERFFDHRDPRGEGPRDRIAAQGYEGRAWGENIAAGQRSPQSVVRAWMDSPGHCKNILNGLFTELGVGVILGARGEYGTYWVQNFGRR